MVADEALAPADAGAAVERDLAPLVAACAGAIVAAAATLAWQGFAWRPAHLLAALFLGGALPALAVEAWRHGVTSPVVLFVGGLGFYHVLIPVQYLIDPKLPHAFVAEYGHLTEAQLAAPLLVTDLALYAFLVGYAVRRPRPTPPPVALDDRRLVWSGWAFFAIGAAMYLAMSLLATGSLFGIFATSYRERDELFYGLGSLAMGMQLVYVGLITLGIRGLARGTTGGALLAVAVCALMGLQSFLVGSKMHVFQVGVGILAGSRATGRRIRAGTLALLLAVVAVPVLFVGLARNKQGEGLDAMAQFVSEEADADAVNPANIDAYGPYLTLVHTVDTLPIPGGLRLGSTYLQVLTLLPPRWLYPNRPTPLPEEFAQDFLGARYYDNAGFGYSPVAEAYLNFGPPGVIVVFLLAGVGFGAVRDALGRRRGQLAAAIVYGTAAPTVLILCRYPISMVPKGYALMTLLPTMVLLWLARRREP